MVLTNPNISFRNSGNNIKEAYHQESYSQNSFPGLLGKKNFDRNNLPEKKFKPLNAAKNNQTQPAFKGLNFVRGFKKIAEELIETDIRQADDLLGEIKEILHIERINGLRHLEGYISRAVNPVTGKKLGQEGVYVLEPIQKTLPEALISVPRMFYREIKRLIGGEKARNKVKTIRTNTGKLNNLLGYYREALKYGKLFDDAFSPVNIQKIKNTLQKKDKKAFDTLIRELKLRPQVVIREAAGGVKDFDLAAKNLLQNIDNKDFIGEFRKKYITGVINMTEADKAGAFMPNFSNSSAQAMTRVTTGAVTATLVANDFYNLKMLASDNEEKAKEKRNQMFKQQAANIIVAAYVGYLINSVFKRIVNNSLPFAVGVGAVTALAANIISRAMNDLPLLPINPKKLDKEPFVINATPIQENIFETKDSDENSFSLYKNSNTFRAFKGNSDKLAFSGWNASELAGKARARTAGLYELMARKMPSRMTYEDFKRGYLLVKEANPEHAAEILRIAARHMRHIDETLPKEIQGLNLSHIEKAASTNKGEVIIGRNYLYRFTESFIKDVVMFPVKLVSGIARRVTNLGLKALGKEEIPKPKSKGYNPEMVIKNYMKWAKEAELRSQKTGISIQEEYGERFSSLHGPNVMKYSNSDLSNFMKLTGFISVPFLAMDAYNTSAEETGNRNISVEKAKQRVIQDSVRQGISYWAVQSWNSLFKDLNNHSLVGSGVSTALNNAFYEVLTRLAVGQPVTPKTHQEMKEIEKKRLRSDSWISKILGRKVKTEDEKVILSSKELREFPGVNSVNHMIATSLKSADARYKRFKESIKAPSSF